MTQASPVEQAGKRLVFEDSIEVPAPMDEVYRRWADFTRFPEFMSNVEEVRHLGDNRYHWVARIVGVKEEWDAEVTDQEPNRRLSWSSTSGPYNAGTVTFNPVDEGKTAVWLRLEYTPPGGKAGQALDSITRVTKREVKEDLHNFKRLMKGEQVLGVEPSESEQAGEGLGRVLISFAPPATGALLGGLTAYYVERNTRPIFSAESLGKMVRNPAAFMAAQRIGLNRPTLPFTRYVAAPWAAVGWVFTGLSAASVAAGAMMRFLGRKNDSLFVGQWAPTFLGLGIFSRVLGSRGVTYASNAIASWSFFGACMGSILASAYWRATGKRKDSLFVGQWAPTLLSAAIVSRLFKR
jgi:uncharacterized membrane protein